MSNQARTSEQSSSDGSVPEGNVPDGNVPDGNVSGGYVSVGQEFVRDTNYIDDRITRDGIGPAGGTFPVEAGRYRLVVARACPWANRAMIVRRLLGLEDALSMGMCGPTHDAD